jgi:hypothetical protein
MPQDAVIPLILAFVVDVPGMSGWLVPEGDIGSLAALRLSCLGGRFRHKQSANYQLDCNLQQRKVQHAYGVSRAVAG